jgi:addiction module RelE/StbE family toxin
MVLNWSSAFKRAFKKTTKSTPDLKEKIISAMNLLEQDPFNPKLKSHKLQGILEDNWACAVSYDLRIIFTFVKNSDTNETEILLINLGTHEEVY